MGFLAGIRMVSNELFDGEPDGFVCELSGFFEPFVLDTDTPLIVLSNVRDSINRGGAVATTACADEAVYRVEAEGRDCP